MLDIRYVAGLFDGEGCISLVKQKRARCEFPSYSVRVAIAMTHQPIIKLLHAQFGGNMTSRTGDQKARNAFSLMWCDKKARPFLEQITPHLILKREEAEIALHFMDNLAQMGTAFWRRGNVVEIQALQDKREAVRQRLASLKRVEYSVSGM